MTPYINLLQKVLTREFELDNPKDIEQRQQGLDWPATAETMVGSKRLQNVADVCRDVIRRDVCGDFIECGCWRGGVCILMAAIAKEMARISGLDYSDRMVWVADSFQGCPSPSPDRYPADVMDPHHTLKFLAVPRTIVQRNFERYDLMGPNVKFLEGWFKDTLPGPVQRLAVLRVDADMYESTIQALEALYDKVSKSGYVIIDDYGAVAGCRKAVDDFREKHSIKAIMHTVDWTGRYWQV